MSQPTVDTGGRFAGTGQVDIGGWLSEGWNIISQDLVTFAAATLLAAVLAVFTIGILAPAMTCGILMMVYRKKLYGRVEIGNLFDGFQRFGPAFLTGLILFALGLVISGISEGPGIAVGLLMPDEMGPAMAAELWSWVSSVVLNALLYGAVFFALPHVAARNAGPVDALQASYNVFLRNVFMFTLTAFLFQLISGLGVVACCIGVFITGPLVMAATAQAYIDHFGIEDLDIA